MACGEGTNGPIHKWKLPLDYLSASNKSFRRILSVVESFFTGGGKGIGRKFLLEMEDVFTYREATSGAMDKWRPPLDRISLKNTLE